MNQTNTFFGLSTLKQKRNLVIMGILLFLFLLIIPAIGLHFLGSEPNPGVEIPTVTQTDVSSKNESESSIPIENITNDINPNQDTDFNTSNTTTDSTIDSPLENISDGQETIPEIDPIPPAPGSGGSGHSSNSGSSGSDTKDTDEPGEPIDPELEEPDCLIRLPTYPVIAQFSYDFNDAYFLTDINGIFDFSDIENGTYLGWCIDYDNEVNTSLKNVTLHSSYCAPEYFQIPLENWSAVNYILNHKPQNVSYWDIQTAIWYYVNIGTTSIEPTEKGWDIINNVTIHNGTAFVPESGDIIGVIVEPVENLEDDQLAIIEIMFPGIPEIHIVKTANMSTAEVGDLVQYTYFVTNKGVQTIHNISVYDDMLGFIALNVTMLAENESAVGYAFHQVNETDLPGPVINTAIVNGTASNGMKISDNDTEIVLISYNTSISILKSADTFTATVGDTITYSYIITNTGDVTLYDIMVIDDLLGPITLSSTILAPSAWMKGTISYIVDESDLPGPIINWAHVTAHDILEFQVNDSDSFSVLLNVNTSIEITKSANTSEAHVHDKIGYTYTIENTGDLTLYDIMVIDDKLGVITLKNTTLLPGEQTTSRANYTITCSDASETLLVNTVNVSAISQLNETIYDMANETVEIIYEPDIMMNKTVFDANDMVWKESIISTEGDILTFNLTLKNPGDEHLSDILVMDRFPSQLVFTGNASFQPFAQSDHHLEWKVSYLAINETISFTYEVLILFPGIYENNAIVTVETCRHMINASDYVQIIAYECPSEVWVKYDWENQSMVDLFNPSLIHQYNAFSSIQPAIDAVCECGRVYVLSGSYEGQLFINKNLSLMGENTETTYLSAGNHAISIQFPESHSNITPVIMAYGGTLTPSKKIIGNGSISFTIDGFTFLNDSSMNHTAVSLRNVRLGCIENKVVNTSIQGFQSGIQLWHSSNVLVDRNLINNSDTAINIDAGSDQIEVTHNWLIDDTVGIHLINNSPSIPSQININYNYIDTFCSNDIGLINEINRFMVNATDNWWGSENGPDSSSTNPVYDGMTGRLADSADGELVIGTLRFDPYAGLGAVAKISTIEGSVGEYIRFDASQSWGYTGQFGPDDWDSSNFNYLLHRIPLDIWEYKWDFGDGEQGYQKQVFHAYDEPGQYQVMLQIRSADAYLERVDGYRPDEDGHIFGYAYYTITIS